MKKQKINEAWVLFLRDGYCLGSTQPMNKKECDLMAKNCLELGYDVAAVCLNKLFDSSAYMVIPEYCQRGDD